MDYRKYQVLSSPRAYLSENSARNVPKIASPFRGSQK